jgi:hypothetical protein
MISILLGKLIHASFKNIMLTMDLTVVKKLLTLLKLALMKLKELLLLEANRTLTLPGKKPRNSKSMQALRIFQNLSYQLTLTGETLTELTLHQNIETKVIVVLAIQFPSLKLLSRD